MQLTGAANGSHWLRPSTLFSLALIELFAMISLQGFIRRSLPAALQYSDVSEREAPLTLLDLLRLIRHYWKVVILLPLFCALVALLISFALPSKYEASSTITASDPSNNVSPATLVSVVNDFLHSEIAPYTVSDSAVKATINLGEGPSEQTLVLTIEGPSEDECVALANSLVARAADSSRKMFELLQEANEEGLADLSALNSSEDVASVLSGSILQNSLGSDRTFEFCSFLVGDAVEAERVGYSKVLLTLAGFALGLFLAVLIVLIIDALKNPIRSCDEIEGGLSLPILAHEDMPHFGDQLWANIQFLAEERVDSICLVPLSGDTAKVCANALEEAMAKVGQFAEIQNAPKDKPIQKSEQGDQHCVVYCCEPLEDGIGAAYCAHTSSVTVVCARLWNDSRKELFAAIHELSFARANIAGTILLREKKADGHTGA